MNRYFLPNPMVMGPLEFLAGFGQQRQAVHAAEAGMDWQQNQLLSQGIAQAGQGLAQGITQAAVLPYQTRQDMARMTAAAALQRGNQSALEQLSSQGDLYRQAMLETFRRTGRMPPSVAEMTAPGGMERLYPSAQPSLLDVYEPGMGPPAPGAPGLPPVQPQPVPPGSIPEPVMNPAMIQEYRQAEEKARAARLDVDTQLLDPHMPREHRESLMRNAAPKVAELEARVRRYPQPKPPRTYEELVNLGVGQGGITPIPGTANFFVPDNMKMTAATHAPEENVFAKLKTPEQRQAYGRQQFIGNWDKFEDRGGYGWMDNEGNPKFDVLPPDRAKTNYETEWEEAYRVLKQKNDSPKYEPSQQEITQYRERKHRGALDLEMREKQGQTSDELAGFAADISNRASELEKQRERTGLPVTLEAIRALQEIQDHYPNAKGMPPAVQNSYRQLARLAGVGP